MDWLIEPFRAPFMQRALAEVLLLALAGGVLGAWIVARRLAFFTHATGTAAFPGLVVAGPWGIAPQLAALACALLFATGLGRLVRARSMAPDVATGLLLVLALATGTVLASDAYPTGAGVDRLLFGTVLGIGDRDIAVAAGAAGVALGAAAGCHRAWLAATFDPAASQALGIPTRRSDALLLLAIAVAVIAALPAAGALLVSSLFVLPAATARLHARSLPGLLAGSTVTAVALGAGGLWLAFRLDAPPGPAIAVLGGALYGVAALARAARGRAVAVASVGAAAVLLAGCGGDGAPAPRPDAKIVAAATTRQVASLVRRVGGRRVSVTPISRGTDDPRTLEPDTRSTRIASDAQVIFRSGAGLDGWVLPLAQATGHDERVVDLAKSVVLREHQGTVDPAWWLDPRNAIAAVTRIRDALGSADSDGYGPYRARAERTIAMIRGLDRRLAACFATIPPAARRAPARTGTIAYLELRYGLTPGGPPLPPGTRLYGTRPPAGVDLFEALAHDGSTLANALGAQPACSVTAG